MAKTGKYIGGGSFSSVYRDPENDNKVLIISTDKAKAAIAEGFAQSDMLPEFKQLGFATDRLDDERRLYRSKFYPKVRAPKQQLSKSAYKKYVMLRKTTDRIKFSPNPHDSYSLLFASFETIPDKKLRREMINILEGMAMYGSDVCFEISPRNIAVGKYKTLVLLDCFFFKEDLLKIRFER